MHPIQFLAVIIQLALVLQRTWTPFCNGASLISMNGIREASDSSEAANLMDLRKRSGIEDAALNSFQTVDVRSSNVDDDAEDVINYVRSKQHQCIDDVCSVITARFGSVIDIETCALRYCSVSLLASGYNQLSPGIVESPSKRWNSRLCMQMHCRSVEHNIASYVNCGIKNCTK